MNLTEHLVRTGYFRDEKRRIDVVLVLADDNDNTKQKLKVQYLLNVIEIGLELEVEPGVLMEHKHLVFVKIHAPNNILEYYSQYYDLKFPFKKYRVELIKPGIKFVERLCPIFRNKYEKVWIKDVRAQEDSSGFSTIERSRIVYYLLLHLPFGNHENEVGLERLLKQNAIKDVFALHDGPYFFVNRQELTKCNNRQLLYYNWAINKQTLRTQPLHLIHEYFAERIALFFAFFGFYNVALGVATIIGIMFTLLEFFDTSDDVIVDETCNDETTIICPLCKSFYMCPFKKLKDYCMTAKIVNMIDNPFTLYFSIFISTWAIITIGLWRRTEHYWCWMWGLTLSNVKTIIRPEYESAVTDVKKSKYTGIKVPVRSLRTKILRYTFISIIVFICFMTVILTIGLLLLFKYWISMLLSRSSTENWVEYIAFSLYGGLNIILLFALDGACTYISYKLTDFENHQTQYSYEKSLVIKLYAFTFAFTFPMLLFFSYLKGAFYTYPSDPSRWDTLLGIGMQVCSPFGCLDEVWIMLATMLIFKQIILRFIAILPGMRTDYNQGMEANKRVPCWEREYKLKPITEAYLFSKYRILVTQFGFATLFVAAFPLAPLFALIANIWDLRYMARLILLGSRRPLSTRATGMGIWRDVFVAVAYASALTNGLTVTFTTKTIQRMIYTNDHHNLSGFIHWSLSKFSVNDYLTVNGPDKEFNEYHGFKPTDICMYTGQREPPDSPSKYKVTGTYYRIKYDEILFIIIYEHMVFLLIFIFHYIIPPLRTDVRDTIVKDIKYKNTLK